MDEAESLSVCTPLAFLFGLDLGLEEEDDVSNANGRVAEAGSCSVAGPPSLRSRSRASAFFIIIHQRAPAESHASCITL